MWSTMRLVGCALALLVVGVQGECGAWSQWADFNCSVGGQESRVRTCAGTAGPSTSSMATTDPSAETTQSSSTFFVSGASNQSTGNLTGGVTTTNVVSSSVTTTPATTTSTTTVVDEYGCCVSCGQAYCNYTQLCYLPELLNCTANSTWTINDTILSTTTQPPTTSGQVPTTNNVSQVSNAPASASTDDVLSSTSSGATEVSSGVTAAPNATLASSTTSAGPTAADANQTVSGTIASTAATGGNPTGSSTGAVGTVSEMTTAATGPTGAVNTMASLSPAPSNTTTANSYMPTTGGQMTAAPVIRTQAGTTSGDTTPLGSQAQTRLLFRNLAEEDDSQVVQWRDCCAPGTARSSAASNVCEMCSEGYTSFGGSDVCRICTSFSPILELEAPYDELCAGSAIGAVLYRDLNFTVVLEDLHDEGLVDVTGVSWSNDEAPSADDEGSLTGEFTLNGISSQSALEVASRNTIEATFEVEIGNLLLVDTDTIAVNVLAPTTTGGRGLRRRRRLAAGESAKVAFSVSLAYLTTTTTTTTTNATTTTTDDDDPGEVVNNGSTGISDVTVIGLSVAGGVLFLVLIGLIIGFVLMRAQTQKKIREINDQAQSVTSHVQVERGSATTGLGASTPGSVVKGDPTGRNLRRTSQRNTPVTKQKKNITLEDWIERNGLDEYRELLQDLGVKRVADILLLVPSDFKSVMSFDEGRRLIQSAREAVGESRYDASKLQRRAQDDEDDDGDGSDSSSNSSTADSKHGPGSTRSHKSHKKDKKRDKKSRRGSRAALGGSDNNSGVLMTPKDMRAKRRQARRERRKSGKKRSSSVSGSSAKAVHKWVQQHKLGDDVLVLLTKDFGVEHLSDLKLLEKADFINQGMSKSNVKKVWKAIQSLD